MFVLSICIYGGSCCIDILKPRAVGINEHQEVGEIIIGD
jgi:hypothetical protein